MLLRGPSHYAIQFAYKSPQLIVSHWKAIYECVMASRWWWPGVLTSSQGFHGDGGVGHGVGVAGGLQVLRLPSGPVFVFWVILHVLSSDSFGLVYEGSFLLLTQELPLGAESLRNFWVVHFWVLLRYLAPLHSRPDHEGIHWSLDVFTRFPLGLFLLIWKYGGDNRL